MTCPEPCGHIKITFFFKWYILGKFILSLIWRNAICCLHSYSHYHVSNPRLIVLLPWQHHTGSRVPLYMNCVIITTRQAVVVCSYIDCWAVALLVCTQIAQGLQKRGVAQTWRMLSLLYCDKQTDLQQLGFLPLQSGLLSQLSYRVVRKKGLWLFVNKWGLCVSLCCVCSVLQTVLHQIILSCQGMEQ